MLSWTTRRPAPHPWRLRDMGVVCGAETPASPSVSLEAGAEAPAAAVGETQKCYGRDGRRGSLRIVSPCTVRRVGGPGRATGEEHAPGAPPSAPGLRAPPHAERRRDARRFQPRGTARTLRDDRPRKEATAEPLTDGNFYSDAPRARVCLRTMCGVEMRPIAQMDVVDAEYARDAALEAADHVERIERETVLERRARSAPVDRARIGTEHFAHSSASLWHGTVWLSPPESTRTHALHAQRPSGPWRACSAVRSSRSSGSSAASWRVASSVQTTSSSGVGSESSHGATVTEESAAPSANGTYGLMSSIGVPSTRSTPVRVSVCPSTRSRRTSESPRLFGRWGERVAKSPTLSPSRRGGCTWERHG